MREDIDLKYILDYDRYKDLALEAISEGQVLLENKENTLPLNKGAKVALFGRSQNHYYKSGTGSGGMVNVSRVVGILDALKESAASGDIVLNEQVLSFYEKYEEENPFKEADGWANAQWSVPEAPLEDSLVKASSMSSDYALFIIGRSAGEDQDNSLEEGSYLLSSLELDALKKVRAYFKKVIVVLNVGNIIDMKFVKDIGVDALLYAWQGGMLGGYGTVNVLLGKVNPSGKLPDTIAYSIEDYPSDKNFGNPNESIYEEDIFVGYRYFETFAPSKVLYPFGYGLSYTDFDLSITDFRVDPLAGSLGLDVRVKNTGSLSGKEVVQVYVTAPQGLLGKPARVLCGFKKTSLLAPGSCEVLSLDVDFRDFASFDETSKCGLGTGFILEKGEYRVYAGNSVRATEYASFELMEDMMIEPLKNALGPVKPFKRLLATGEYEDAPLRTDTQKARRNASIPALIPMTGDLGYKLSDVFDGKVTMEEFIGQLSLEELNVMPRGEGMSSKLVTPGTAAAFGGIIPSLKDKGIPIGCMDDGPSGMRLDSGMHAFSLPNGTCLSSTFNTSLNAELFSMLGREMLKNKVDVLLGPGMNIHRHPLNGRNFEYFSEDPFLTGKIGGSQILGLQSVGVTGTIKHFACNNQENGRQVCDPVVSERALREIYLKGFEYAVNMGADAVMTTYALVNGVYTAGNYDLVTTILHDQWGFKGIVMTDWWANISDEDTGASKTNFAAMVRAQNDLYCCVPGATEDVSDNILSSVEDGTLAVSELQRTAMNVCAFFEGKAVMKRLTEEVTVELSGASEEYEDALPEVSYIPIESETVIDLRGIDCSKGSKYYFGTEIDYSYDYEITLTGTGLPGNELAQLPVVFYSNATPLFTCTFRGNGKEASVSNIQGFYNRLNIMYLYFTLGGVELKELRFKRIEK